MRPVWKGHISFGLVSVPVSLFTAEMRTDIQLRMIDSRDMSRIRYERVNADTGDEVPWKEVVKGYEYSDGNYVVLTDKELKEASPRQTKTIDIESFVELAQIDQIYFDKPYYIAPVKGGEKGYVLLREVLNESGQAGIARVVIRTRQYVAAMVPRGEVLVLNLLRYPEEIRSFKDLDLPGAVASVGIKPAELKMAKTLVDSMSAKWDPSQYQDEFRDTLMKWIEKRGKAGEVEQVAEGEDNDAPAPLSIMEALKKSLGRESKHPAATSKSKKVAKKRKVS